jgi:hypothetical protein
MPGKRTAQLAKHPPLARLALRVGVTGHRPKDLGDVDLEVLRAKIRTAVQFTQEFVANLEGVKSWYEHRDRPILRVVSALAEGADRLVAVEALALGFELQCPLPFAAEEYEKDFDSPESRNEFRDLVALATAVLELEGSREKRVREDESYEAAGRLVLNQSDLLIAIWNGEQRNLRGGTSQIVVEAISRNIPVIWIDSKRPHRLSVRVRADSTYAQGTDLELADEALWQPWETGSKPLSRRLESLLVPPVESGLPEQYFSEIQPRSNGFGVLWKMFRDCWADLRPRWPVWTVANFSHCARDEWRRIWRLSPHFPKEAIELIERSRLPEHYGWADGLADYYANRYRSAFVFNYLMGSVAVLFGFLAFALERHARFCAGCEFVILVIIVSVYILARRRRWYERWIDYRLLAEHFRQMLFLLALGPTSLLAVHPPIFLVAGDPRNTWMYWHFGAYLRQAGLLNARLTANYLKTVAAFLKQHSLASQIEYHEKNSERHGKMGTRLHRTSVSLFVLTLLACVGHFVWDIPWVFTLIGVVATSLPALAAALAGIQNQGEFERIEKRSEAMKQQLESIGEQLDNLLLPATQIRLAALSQIAGNAAQLMIDELLDWRVVFKVKSGPELG